MDNSTNLVIDNSRYWWKDLTSKYVIRELTLEDLDQIINLIKLKNIMWKTLIISDNDLEQYIKLYKEKFNDPLRWKCIGAFLNDDLVMETSSYFPLNTNFWYSTSLRHKSENTSLMNGNLQRYLFADCFIPMLNYGEKLKKFSFYAMRSLAHQKIINRMWDRRTEESPLARYDYYIDGIIPANTQNQNLIYKFFFPNNKTYSIDLVVYLHCLKHKHRLELLN